jgi:hypothetical protein
MNASNVQITKNIQMLSKRYEALVSMALAAVWCKCDC